MKGFAGLKLTIRRTARLKQDMNTQKMKSQIRHPVRLTPGEIQGLCNAFENILRKDDCKVYLFGSRTDPDGKGGDIDLLIECGSRPSESLRLTRALRLKIYDQIGEQKIDIVWDYPEKKDPFVRMQDESRILLWKRIREK